jgi:N-acyl homoserine lactone hydrolase
MKPRLPAAPRRRVLLALFAAAFAFASVFTWRLFDGAAVDLTRARYPVPASSFSDWDEVFARAPKLRWIPIDTGEVGVERQKMLRRDAPPTCDDASAVPLRVYAHLVRHPIHGDVLIDSGLDASFATAAYGNIQWPARWVLAVLVDAPYRQRAGEDVAAQLAQHGATVRKVFFTHLHMDHTAGVPALPADVELVTGPGEADDAYQVFGFGHIPASATLRELDFEGAPVLAPLGPALDLFGDGSLWAISTPGHSRGHVSFVVNAEHGPVLLAGDASHFRCGFEHGIGPAAPEVDEELRAQESLDRLRAFADRHPQVQVFLGHEAPSVAPLAAR